jgi:hypothetical protein
MPFESQHELLSDLSLAFETQRAGTSTQYAKSGDRSWDKWTEFCVQLNVEPYLQDIADPIRLLEIFAVRVRDGRLSKSGKPVRAATVGQCLSDVGQAFSRLGTPDPRLDSFGNIDFRLKRLKQGMHRADPAPTRTKPIPIPILHHAVNKVYNDPNPKPALQASVDMMIVGYYFLMRPGEHCHTTAEGGHPFLFENVELFIGSEFIDIETATLFTLQAATFVKLTFTIQKNGVRGEKIGHGRSGHLLFCPVLAIVRRLWHHRTHRAPTNTPLHCWFATVGGVPHNTASTTITKIVRDSCAALGDFYGVKPSEICARSLRASGAMALLCARVDPDWIQLMGRWKSDAMLDYLHVQAAPIMQDFAARMLNGGHYSFRPGQHHVPLPPEHTVT